MRISSPALDVITRALRRVFTVLLVAGSLAFGALPADAAPTSVDAERDFAALVNVERAKRGLGALRVRSDIVGVARRHSATMASRDRLHHNPSFTTQIEGWKRLSENVGYGPDVQRIHDALMKSDGHRKNILDDRVTEIGVGVTVADRRVWVTQNFRRPASDVRVSPASMTTFGDVPSTNVHTSSITTVTAHGITDVCGTARFCPTDAVTRGQFATMLVRALDLPVTNDRRFDDVSGPHAADVEALAAAELTAGCSRDRFCPDTRLTREQMATFFARALEAEPESSPFDDVSGTHDGSVGALHARAIVKGCTATDFCSRDQVTRAQTASMIANNLS